MMNSRYLPMPTLAISKRPCSHIGSLTICCCEPTSQSTAATVMNTRPMENSTWSRCGRLYIGR